MQIKIIDPATKEALILHEFFANIQGNFNTALGKDPSASHYRCSEESQKMWPIFFDFTANGYIDTTKEGRLQVVATAFYKIEKGGSPESKNGYTIRLVREAIGEKLGGYVQHDRIAKMIREHSEKLLPQAKACLLVEISKAQKKEEECSSAHAARGRVAKMILSQLKQKSA